MKVALIGAELEENLGLRYMASALEAAGHEALILPFNEEADIASVVHRVRAESPDIAGLSMVFTGRAREFCRLAEALREGGFTGHLTAGGHFAALNARQLLADFPAFDSVALGEGEELICALAAHLDDLSPLPGFCYRTARGEIALNPGTGNPENLDALPFPRRTTFHEYFGQPIASILSSRGCWRECAFCSIDAWYRSGGGRKFRIRGIDNIIAEMSSLYHEHGIRIFNFQDDNFFLPDPTQALARFQTLREGLRQAGVEKIAIAVKARPDSITREAMEVLDDLGIFRVFLGVENASQRGLDNLNRKNTVAQIENALRILNDYDLHIAYNLLMFEPDTSLEDLRINLRFMERHVDNPFNFCRAEAYAFTGLEEKLRADGILEGDYFGFDYRIKDARVECFHKIANYAFFDRNFSDYGLHYFNMEVDFSYLLLRRFFPEKLSEELRAEVRCFIKQTNIDTYRHLCRIYDLVREIDPGNRAAVQDAMRSLRRSVDEHGISLRAQGEGVLQRLQAAYDGRPAPQSQTAAYGEPSLAALLDGLLMRDDAEHETACDFATDGAFNFFGALKRPIPYDQFKSRLENSR
ncbi:B12-binding domain-containing radical SAM protein [Geoalkalibacter halelectricus]|uniref:B12-binding domain-containing radical SAM protein n=1 Tax=Geoalkalibacter halelectricus TaxID=2847045 RepID=UPI003D1A89F9